MDSARRRAQGLGTETKRIGEIAAGILTSQVFARLASAAKQAFVSTIHAASNLNESINAVQVTFGDAAEGVLFIGESAAQSMGMSRREFNEAAVRFSAFAKTIAGSGGDVAGVVQDVTRRAADFASVMNLDVSEAMRLFQSGLAGESEPLRRYGIDVSAAAVNTFAWSNGIAEAGRQLTEQEKVQARYGLIMEATSDTAGDFARTSGDLANAQRILGAELENAQASMGQNFLPVLATLSGFLTDVLVGFQALPGPVQAAVGIIAGLTAALGAAAIAARAFNTSLRTIATNPLVIGATLVLGAVAVALQQVGANARKGAGDVQALADSLDQASGAITDNSRQIAFNTLEADGWLAKAEQIGISSGDLVDAWLGESDALERVRGRLRDLIDEGGQLSVYAGIGTAAFSEQADAARDLLGVLSGGEGTMAEARERIRRMGESGLLTADEVTEASEEIDAALASVREDALATAESWGSSIEGMIDANEALKAANDELEEDQELTTAAFLEQFEKRLQIAREHNDNIVAISERASADVRDQMLEDVRENPQLAAAMVAATDAEWARMESAYRERVRLANTAANRELVRNTPALTAIAREAGTAAAEGLAQKIRDGAPLTVAEVRQIMAQAKTAVEAEKLQALIKPSLDEAGRAAAEARLNFLARPRSVPLSPSVRRLLATTGRASGGIIGAEAHAQGGGPRFSRVLVGEHRAEVVELPVGSRVIPSVDQALDRGQVGGDGTVINIDLTGAVISGEAQFERMVIDAVQRAGAKGRITIRGRRL